MIVALLSPSDLSEPSAEFSSFVYWGKEKVKVRANERETETEKEREVDSTKVFLGTRTESSMYINSNCILLSRVQLPGQPNFKGG